MSAVQRHPSFRSPILRHPSGHTEICSGRGWLPLDPLYPGRGTRRQRRTFLSPRASWVGRPAGAVLRRLATLKRREEAAPLSSGVFGYSMVSSLCGTEAERSRGSGGWPSVPRSPWPGAHHQQSAPGLLQLRRLQQAAAPSPPERITLGSLP